MEKHVHFIGIGGIGMSALARYFLAQGSLVTGSDLTESDITAELEADGAKLSIGHRAENVKHGTTLVVYSAAVHRDNPELEAALTLGARIASYPEAIGEVSKQFDTIAIAGSHGKSTTTALVALVLERAGFDPTVIIGTKLREFKNRNFRQGKSKWLVLEADEYGRAFHHYAPQLAVVTNIDREHLDTYKTFAGVAAGFSKFLKNVHIGGFIIANWKDKHLRRVAASAAKSRKAKLVWFNRNTFPRHSLNIPGVHNQLNAEAAWQTVKLLGVRKATAEAVLSGYRGAWRRLEKLKTKDGIRAIVYSDYAHHPTEIKATLQALRERHPIARLVIVFQPHQQDRLTRLFREFTKAFNGADKVILMPVYKVAGREEGKGTDSFALAQEIATPQREVSYAQDMREVMRLVAPDLLDGRTIAVFMGAGDIDAMARDRVSE